MKVKYKFRKAHDIDLMLEFVSSLQPVSDQQNNNVGSRYPSPSSNRTITYRLLVAMILLTPLSTLLLDADSQSLDQSEPIDDYQSTQSTLIAPSKNNLNLSLNFGANHVPGTLIVTLKPNASSASQSIATSGETLSEDNLRIRKLQDKVRQLHQEAGVQEIRKLRSRSFNRDRLVIIGDREQSLLENLALQYHDSDLVESVSLDYVAEATLVPNDDNFSDLWGMKKISAPEAWDKRTNAENIVIAVLDTGIDYNHSDLISNVWTNELEIPGDGVDNDGNGFVDDVIGWDFVDDDPDPIDDYFPTYHGTHVAGIIGAVGNNSLGVAGVAWDVQIMTVKVLDNKGQGSVSDLVEGIEYAVENGADVINMCFGAKGPMPTELQSSLEISNQFEVIAVIAAGNNGIDVDKTTYWPGNATLENTVTVVNTDSNDSRPEEVGGMVLKLDEEVPYFTWGKRFKTNFGKYHTDLSAPGTEIYSTARLGKYQFLSGTSMAAPHVSGAIALTWSEYQNDTYTNVIDRVLGNVDLVPELGNITSTGGRLNLSRCFDGITHITHTAVRGYVGPADEKLIQGFTLIGNSAKRIVVTSAGPSLAPILGNQVVKDTSIALYGPSGLITSNDDFVNLPFSSKQELERISATPEGAKESAIVETLDPGVYTVVMEDPQNTYGIGLLNLYETTSSDLQRFAGCSARVSVGEDNQVGILSFVISGKGKRRVLIKTNGPELVNYGIRRTLNDPKIELHQGSTLIAENDSWKDFDGPRHALEEELDGRGIILPTEKDALIYENLSPGSYSVIVKGLQGESGVCLLEVIEYR